MFSVDELLPGASLSAKYRFGICLPALHSFVFGARYCVKHVIGRHRRERDRVNPREGKKEGRGEGIMWNTCGR